MRRMVSGGFLRKNCPERAEENGLPIDYGYKYANTDLVKITKTTPIRDFIFRQQIQYTAHICRLPNTDMRKKLLFSERKGKQSIWVKFSKKLQLDEIQVRKTFMNKKLLKVLLDKVF